MTKDNSGVPTVNAPNPQDKNEFVNKTVIVKPEQDIKMVEEEVPQAVIKAEAVQKAKLKVKADVVKELKGMVENQFEDIKDYLESLKKDKFINSYKTVPIGMATTLEMEPGRVTVVVDSTGRVIDIEIS